MPDLLDDLCLYAGWLDTTQPAVTGHEARARTENRSDADPQTNESSDPGLVFLPRDNQPGDRASKRRWLIPAAATAAVLVLAGLVLLATNADKHAVYVGPTNEDLPVGRTAPLLDGIVVRYADERSWTVLDLSGRELGSVPAVADLDATGDPLWVGPTVPGYDPNHPEHPLLIDTAPELQVVEQWAPTGDGGAPASCDGALSSEDIVLVVCREAGQPANSGAERTVRFRRAGSDWDEVTGPPPQLLLPNSSLPENPLGHWRWALPAPNGEFAALQWSGECEAPSTFFATRSPDQPAGVSWALMPVALVSPESPAGSYGLGWTSSGALVVRSDFACGSPINDEPGIYMITPGEEPELLVAGTFRDVYGWSAVDLVPGPNDNGEAVEVTPSEPQTVGDLEIAEGIEVGPTSPPVNWAEEVTDAASAAAFIAPFLEGTSMTGDLFVGMLGPADVQALLDEGGSTYTATNDSLVVAFRGDEPLPLDGGFAGEDTLVFVIELDRGPSITTYMPWSEALLLGEAARPL